MSGSLKDKLNLLYYPARAMIPLPLIVMVEPTNACNLKCAMCYVQHQKRQNYYLSVPEFKYIISQFPKIRELIFCGIGESLLNKDLFEMIDIAKKKGVDFINLFTNGKLLNDETITKIVASGINRIQISIHSFDPGIFSKIRNDDSFDLEELKLSIRKLISLKKSSNSRLKVCCNAVINKFNYKNLSEFIREAKDLGFDRVELVQMTTAKDSLKSINAPLGPIRQITRQARRLARSLKIELGFLSGNDSGRCYQMWDFIMIHSDGNISPCNGIFPTENIGVGNILKEPIEKIWNAPRYQELRRLVRAKKLENCIYCECGYCLEGRDFTWFKNYYIRPLRRLFRYFKNKFNEQE